MSFRPIIGSCVLAVFLSVSPTAAQTPRAVENASSYSYYKTRQGESVSGVAAKFGMSVTSLLRMNPQFLDGSAPLLPGSLLFVPKKPERPTSLSSRHKNKPKARARAAGVGPTKSKKKRRAKKRKPREEPSKAEWARIAEWATNGKPEVEKPVIKKVAPKAPPSRFVRSDGQVVFIPAAKSQVKVAPAPKPVKKTDKLKIRSRKGKAIYGVLKTCKSFIGTPYVWGGARPGGFDCSGYIQYVWNKNGYEIPRTADIQFNVGERVKRGKEKPGDLVFFETYAPGASHVGVYLGRGYFIHASSSRGVILERLATDFFAQRYLGAKRTDF